MLTTRNSNCLALCKVLDNITENNLVALPDLSRTEAETKTISGFLYYYNVKERAVSVFCSNVNLTTDL